MYPFFHFQKTLCTKHDEVKLAEEASKRFSAPTIFSKVIDKSIPADIIYEDHMVNYGSRATPVLIH